MKTDNTRGYSLELRGEYHTGIHLHRSMECILVLRGKVQIEIGENEYILEEDSLDVINPGEVHSVRSFNGSLVLVLKIEESKLYQECEKIADNIICVRNKEENKVVSDKIYFELKRNIVKMFATEMEKAYGYELKMNMEFLRFLYLLYSNYSVIMKKEEIKVAKNKLQIEDILRYIEENYKEKLTLDEIAAHFYLSPSYFSRLFKSTVGEGFLHYLQKVRVEKSLEKLLYSDESILEIALEYGFKNARAYTKVFYEEYGKNPSDYRKVFSKYARFQGESEVLLNQTVDEDMRLEFLRYMMKYSLNEENEPKTEIEEKVCIGNSFKGRIEKKNNIVVLQNFEMALKSNFSYVKDMKQKLNVKYIYFPICNDKTNEDENMQSYLHNLVQAVEEIEKYGLMPFIRINFQSEYFTGTNDMILEYINGTLYEALEILGIHFSKEYIETWMVEIVCGNFVSTQREIFYREVYKLVRKFLGNAMIGCFAGLKEEEETESWFEKHLEYSIKIRRTPEFITFHSFQNCVKKRYPLDKKMFEEEKNYHVKATETIKSLCRKYGLDVPLYLTVWNTLSGENDSEISTYVRTAIIWDSLVRVNSQVNGIGYYMMPIAKCQYSKERFGAALNLFLMYDIKMPVYFIVEFFNRMAGDIIFQSDNMLVVKNLNGELIIAMFNVQMLNPVYAIDHRLTDDMSVNMKIKVNGLENREYTVKCFTVDKRSNGAFSRMEKSGYPDWRDADALNYMKNISVGDLVIYRKEAQSNILELKSEIRYNGIVLYIIKL